MHTYMLSISAFDRDEYRDANDLNSLFRKSMKGVEHSL